MFVFRTHNLWTHASLFVFAVWFMVGHDACLKTSLAPSRPVLHLTMLCPSCPYRSQNSVSSAAKMSSNIYRARCGGCYTVGANANSRVYWPTGIPEITRWAPTGRGFLTLSVLGKKNQGCHLTWPYFTFFLYSILFIYFHIM